MPWAEPPGTYRPVLLPASVLGWGPTQPLMAVTPLPLPSLQGYQRGPHQQGQLPLTPGTHLGPSPFLCLGVAPVLSSRTLP